VAPTSTHARNQTNPNPGEDKNPSVPQLTFWPIELPAGIEKSAVKVRNTHLPEAGLAIFTRTLAAVSTFPLHPLQAPAQERTVREPMSGPLAGRTPGTVTLISFDPAQAGQVMQWDLQHPVTTTPSASPIVGTRLTTSTVQVTVAR
jgi:hypothetical protein